MATKRNTFFQDPQANDVEMFLPTGTDTSQYVDRVIAINEQWDELGLDDIYGTVDTIEPNAEIGDRVEKLESMLCRHVEQNRAPAKRVVERV